MAAEQDDLTKQAKALPIPDVARALGLQLRRKGGRWRTRCLRKGLEDTKPSLVLFEDTNTFKCFSCGR